MLAERNSVLPDRLDKLHSWVRSQGGLRRFTFASRILLATAFLPTGTVKAMGDRFTTMSVDTPIGFFFEAMYLTGPYWRFIGIVQILAAALLLIPRFATLGALLFAPISISIFLVTLGIDFGGTVYVSLGMMLSVAYLLFWDVDRVWAATASLFSSNESKQGVEQMNRVETFGWLLGAASAMGLFFAARGFLPNRLMPVLFFVGVAAVVMVLVGWIANGLRRN